ncbi:MAG: hypothetical protein U0359_36175 [Byssovorax sp.]
MTLASHIDPAFVPILEPFGIGRLDASEAPTFGLWSNLRVAYFNAAGEALVRSLPGAPRAWGVGGSILPAIPEKLRFTYVEEMQRVVEKGKAFRHIEDTSRSGLAPRRVHLLPLWGSGLLYTSVPVVEAGAPALEGRPIEALYRADNGFILECSYCHTFRRAGDADRWDWVPDFATRVPAHTTHGTCPICFGCHAR